MLVDTHAHIVSSMYSNINDIINNAKEKGIKKIINCSDDLNSSEEISVLCDKHKGFLCAAIGIHPENVKNVNNNYITKLNDLVKKHNIVAIGEIGLDFHYENIDKKLQKKIFEDQLKFASNFNLPVIIHSRNATNETINILKKYNLRGIIHCFNGSVETAKEYIKMGFLLGIGGIVTFKNCKLINIIKEIGTSSIVFETDAPFLAPVPYRGQKNESAFITHTIDFVSKELNIPYEKLVNIAYENLSHVFDL